MPMRRAERERIHQMRKAQATDENPQGHKGHHDRGGF